MAANRRQPARPVTRPTPTAPPREVQEVVQEEVVAETRIIDPDEKELSTHATIPSEALGGPVGDDPAVPVDTSTDAGSGPLVVVVEAPKTHTVVPPAGKILKKGEPIIFDAEPDVSGNIIATEDVHREVYARGSSRPTYVTLIHKGTRVPVSRVTRTLEEL